MEYERKEIGFVTKINPDELEMAVNVEIESIVEHGGVIIDVKHSSVCNRENEIYYSALIVIGYLKE